MKTKRLFFCIIALTFFFIGCKKHCPEFSSKNLSWIPYEVNETITYKDQNNDSLIFKINYKHHSESYYYSMLEKCECIASAEIKMCSDTPDCEEMIKTEIVEYEYGVIDHFFVTLSKGSNEHCSFYLIYEQEQKDSIIINDVLYPEVFIFEIDTLAYPDVSIWKVIMANNYGIVKFCNRITGSDWILQHN